MDGVHLKLPSKIALGTLALLCLGSLFYYQERMLFSDASWLIYNIINQKQLFIQEHRYGSFITQLFPLIGVGLQLPLKAILILYSLSFNLFPLMVGLILYRQKQFEWLIILALYLSICVSESYYWTNNEVHQGIVWLCATMGLLTSQVNLKNQKISNYILFALLAFLAIFAHPIVLIISIYAFGMFIFSLRQQLRLASILPYAILLVGLIVVKYYLSQHGWYDQAKLDSLYHITSIQSLFQSFNCPTIRNFIHNCLTVYFVFSLLVLFGIGIMIAQKRFVQLVWTLVFMLAYCLCIAVIYPDCKDLFYIESEWMPISIMGVWAISFWGLKQLNTSIATLLLILIFGIQIIRINSSAVKFTKRITCIRSIINEPKIKQAQKVLIGPLTDNDSLRKTLLMSWGLPIETLIYSSLERPNQAVSVRIVDSNELKKLTAAPMPKRFINPFYTERYKELNYHYFKLDSNTSYIVLDSSIKTSLSF